MYFVLKNCGLTICKNWRVRVWPVTWGLKLGFDRQKTTPDRSALGAGCTTTLSEVSDPHKNIFVLVMCCFVIVFVLHSCFPKYVYTLIELTFMVLGVIHPCRVKGYFWLILTPLLKVLQYSAHALVDNSSKSLPRQSSFVPAYYNHTCQAPLFGRNPPYF